MAEYFTTEGIRLVTQGQRRTSPDRIIGIRGKEAKRAGRCSVCELSAHPESLDHDGRCIECQP